MSENHSAALNITSDEAELLKTTLTFKNCQDIFLHDHILWDTNQDMNTVDHHTERCFIIKFFSGCISNVMIERDRDRITAE